MNNTATYAAIHAGERTVKCAVLAFHVHIWCRSTAEMLDDRRTIDGPIFWLTFRLQTLQEIKDEITPGTISMNFQIISVIPASLRCSLIS